jgi:hypothetical protein
MGGRIRGELEGDLDGEYEEEISRKLGRECDIICAVHMHMDLIRNTRFLSLLTLSYENSRHDICKYLSSGTGRSVYFFLLSSSACCITTEACILFVSLQCHIKEQRTR